MKYPRRNRWLHESRRVCRLEFNETINIEGPHSVDEIEASILNDLDIAKRYRWLAVNCNALRNHSRFRLSDTGKELVDAGMGLPAGRSA